jgi:hypothetical protein
MKLSLIAAAVVALLVSRPAVAQSSWSERTLTVPVSPMLKNINLATREHALEFDRPVDIPGIRLEPGVYVFRMMETSVMQVTNINRSKVYAMFMVIPTRSLANTDVERVEFAIGDEALRMVSWYFPDTTGYEFLYPRTKNKQPREEPKR